MDSRSPLSRKRFKIKPIAEKEPQQASDAEDEPSFVPPERIAAESIIESRDSFSTKTTKEVTKKVRFKLPTWATKTRIAIAGVVLVLSSGALVASALFERNQPVVYEPVVEKVEKEPEPPAPTTVASKLTGVQIEPALQDRPIQAVMIENSPDARPQSGLLPAGVVYEAIAEGGITRFLAVFQEAQPDYIGPVRSARPYYVEWAKGYDGGYAHAGGSPEALALINSLGVKDMGDHKSYFFRVSSRFAPHNLYTDMSKLDAYRASKGFTSSDFTPFSRKADSPSAAPTARVINLNISSALYAVRYEYDATSNSYNRFLANKPHTDEKSGSQLRPKVVVALITEYGIHPDRVHSTYRTTGTGEAMVFQDGTLTTATWRKTSQSASLELIDTNGKAVELNAGQTWITAIPSGRTTYTP